MMDFGYLGSSSNLSALAPPFTLDRTIIKPNSEPFLSFTDPPPAVTFSSSLPSWQYSISFASNPNCYSDSNADFGVDSIRTTYLPSESYYPYFGVSSLSSSTTHMPPLNTNVSTSPDAFVFPQFSAPIPTSYVESKPDHDLSSTSQGDYLQSLSGLKCTPHWGSYWDNIDSFADRRMGKQVDCGSYAYKSYPDQGASIAEGFSIGKGKESPPARLDLFGGENQIVTPATVSLANAPVFEATATISNHQKPYGSQNQRFQPLNTSKIESITTKRSSHPVIIRPPPVRLDKKEHFCDSFPSSIREGDLSSKPLKAEKELHLADINATKSVSSVEGPLENLDGYYPALDSPCWKGVSSLRFSPSEDHEPAISEHIIEITEPLGALELSQTQFCTPFGEDNAKSSSQKAPKNGYVELGSLLRSPPKVDDSTHESCSNLGPFNNDIEKSTKEVDSSNDSRICSDLKKPEFENDIGIGVGVAEPGLDCNSASSKLDVQKLVETIHNLSKLLLFQCSDDVSTLSEVDYESLKLAMKNLDACVSKMVPNPTQQSSLRKSVVTGMPPLPKEASSFLSIDNYCPEQEAKNIELSNKEVKKFPDLFSVKVDEDFEKDGKVTQSIKNVLVENFGAKEDMQPEAILYKNLWLEAEATLCAVSFRARYNRVKIEMDKYKLPPKIVEEPAKTFEELYNKVFPDPSSPRKGNPIIEAFKMLHKSNQDPSASRKTESVDEAETSLRARFDILNNRVSDQNFAYAGEQTDEEVDAAFADNIKTVEKLLSSDDSEDCAITKLTQKVPFTSNSFFAPSSFTSKTAENIEASVMARLQILKDRGFSKISQEAAQKSKRVVKEFNVCVSDDLANQIGGNKVLETQISPGCGDGSISDWEDVLKDEFACRN